MSEKAIKEGYWEAKAAAAGLAHVREYSAADTAEHVRSAMRRYEDQCRQEAVREMKQQHMQDALRYLKDTTVAYDSAMVAVRAVPDPHKRPSRVLLLL